MKIGQRVKQAWDGFLDKRGSKETIAQVISWIEEGMDGKAYKLRSIADAISKNAYFRRAYEIIQSQISQLSVLVEDEDGAEIRGNYLTDKVMKQPNEFQTMQQFVEETIGWLLNSGRYGWRPERNGKGQVIMAVNYDASLLMPKSSNNMYMPIGGYNYNGRPIPFEEVIYGVWWTPASKHNGESPFKSALEEAATALVISRVVRMLAENNQRPGGILTPKDGTYQEATMEKIKEAFVNKDPVEHAGELKILPGAMQLLQGIITPHEAQLLETNDSLKKAIFAATGISQILLESGMATFENQAEDMKKLWRLTLLPIIHKIGNSLNIIVSSYDPRWHAKFDLANVMALKSEWKEVAPYIPQILLVASRDEVRKGLPGDFEPLLVGGDRIDGTMNEQVGQAPSVQTKKIKTKGEAKERSQETRGIEEILSKLKEARGKKIIEKRGIAQKDPPQRKEAGGFSGETREASFRMRKAEFDSYRRTFGVKLAKLYGTQHNAIKEYLDRFDDELIGLPSVENWLNWKDEENKFKNMADSSIRGVFIHAATRIYREFRMTVAHKEKINEKAKDFAGTVNETTRNQIEDGLKDILEGRVDKVADLVMRITEQPYICLQDDEEEEPEKKEKLLEFLTGLFIIAQGFRTEVGAWGVTHDAQGYGLTEGMEQGGFDYEQWVSAFLPTSREAHMAADGQVVRVGESFTVDGEALMYPGDLTGSPGNVLGCYCTVMIAKGE